MEASIASEGSGMMENETIYLPLLENGVIAIGDLWDCREAKAEGTLFDKALTPDDIVSNPVQTFSYNLKRIKDSRDIIDEFHISVSLSLEAMGGAVKVNGKASFDADESKKYHQEEIVCSYETETNVIRLINANNVSQRIRDELENGKNKFLFIG